MNSNDLFPFLQPLFYNYTKSWETISPTQSLCNSVQATPSLRQASQSLPSLPSMTHLIAPLDHGLYSHHRKTILGTHNLSSGIYFISNLYYVSTALLLLNGVEKTLEIIGVLGQVGFFPTDCKCPSSWRNVSFRWDLIWMLLKRRKNNNNHMTLILWEMRQN